MKKILFSVLTLVAWANSYAQDDYKKLPSLGAGLIANDFETAGEIRANGLSSVIKNRQYFRGKRLNPGIAVNYVQGVSSHVDFAASLSGSIVNFSSPGIISDGTKKFFMEAAATGNLKLLSDKFYISPFITAGVGGFMYRSSFGAFIPIGLGIQVKATDNVFFLLNSQYRVPVTENAAYHLHYAFTVVSSIMKKKEPMVVPPPPPVVVDRDGDGVLDSLDRCPDTPGLAALDGCPDRDSDGIADDKDKCPDVAGTAKYEGCPVPDTDGDGINDELDKCPTEKGFARYQGCPVPDTDADGVNDEEDKCPARPGPASNMGCPEIAKEVVDKINYAAKNIFFATGSTKLLPKSFKSLDEVASLLKTDETLMINIDGHTDTTGNREKNMTLSDGRANAVKAYLTSKGVADSRMTATGFGPDKAIASNKTAAGRAKNRRVEMTVRNF